MNNIYDIKYVCYENMTIWKLLFNIPFISE